MWTFLHRFRSSSRAFTVIELMMVVGIITVLTGAFLLQQRQFDSSTLLRSVAYKMALAVREAQTYGASVRFTGTAQASAYGMYIGGALPATSYYIFSDNDNDRYYDSGEQIDTFVLNNNFTVTEYCAQPISGAEECGPTVITGLSIVFVRPNTDACIATSPSRTNVCTPGATQFYKSATIKVSSPGGTKREITVTNTGQISVGAPENN